MTADSKGSLGKDLKPATKIKTIKGVHCQISTIITPHRASVGSAKIVSSGPISPTDFKSHGIKP